MYWPLQIAVFCVDFGDSNFLVFALYHLRHSAQQPLLGTDAVFVNEDELAYAEVGQFPAPFVALLQLPQIVP